MERDELEKRYRQAQLHAQAQIAEMQAQEQPAEDTQQDNTEPEAPNVMQTIAQRAGLKTGLAPYTSPDDRLRRWAGLK